MGCYSTMPIGTFMGIVLYFSASAFLAFVLSAFVDKDAHPNIKISLQLSGLVAIFIVGSCLCSLISWFPNSTPVPC